MTAAGATTHATAELGRPAEPARAVAQSAGLRVLMFALHFPPIAAAGTHRTLNFVAELARRGHRIGVVTTSRTDGFRVEPGSLSSVPPGVAIARGFHVDPYLWLLRLRNRLRAATDQDAAPAGSAPAASKLSPQGPGGLLRDYVSRLADVPDRYASWILPAFGNGVRLATELRAEVIYATAPPFSALLAGWLTAEVLGLPLVVDLRDPWALNPFRNNPYASLRSIDDALEAMVVGRARTVILNTPHAERDYRARYGEHERFTTIQNGIAPELFALPRGTPEAGDRIRLLHVGSIYGRRSPLQLVRALESMRAQRPRLFERIAIEQIGPVEDGGALIAALGLADLVGKFTMRPAVSHREAFLEATRAHALLLLGVSGEKPEVQVPAKLFEYLAAGRPVLTLAKPGGAILATFERAGAQCVAADPDDAASIEGALERLVTILDHEHRNGAAPAAAAVFRYENLALELEAVLQRAARGV